MNKSVVEIFSIVRDVPLQRSTWNRLWNSESIGRIAVAVLPNVERIQRIRDSLKLELVPCKEKPERWTPDWESDLLADLYRLIALMQLPGDQFAALYPPRPFHGQSQGITDIFGAKVELQPDGNCFTHPLAPDPRLIDDIIPTPLDESQYWGAVEWIRYAREATGGVVDFRNPVMTGPIDTVNYLLGTTTLLEWVYTEPDTVHSLLEKVTGVIIGMIQALKEAAGGILHSLHLGCIRGGFDMCSELRSLISSSIYEEFEAPYLRKIGDSVGAYAIHSCGSWERTIASAISDPNLRVMNGQIKENDLAALCNEANGEITLSIGRSVNVHDRYTWPDTKSFFEHILSIVPNTQPFETQLSEDDLPLWMNIHSDLRGHDFSLCAPMLPQTTTRSHPNRTARR